METKNNYPSTNQPYLNRSFSNFANALVFLFLIIFLFFSGEEKPVYSILLLSMGSIAFSSLFWGIKGSIFSSIIFSLIFSGFKIFTGGEIAWIFLIYSGIFISFGRILGENLYSISNFYASRAKKIGDRDLLTGVYNRYCLSEKLKKINQKKDLPLSIMMVDINGLKFFNDSYGNISGDELLVKTAKILENSLKKNDLLGRWGDDEFVAVFKNTTPTEAQKVAEGILRETRVNKVKGKRYQVAIGIATKDKPGQPLEDIFQKAEERMDRQKLLASKSKRGTILSILLKTLREKSFETNSHALRMQDMGRKIAQEMGLSQEEIDRLTLLLSLHDLGKITVPENILKKPGKLNKKEWLMVKKHPETGYRIANSTDELSHIAKDILSHHERWDGKGYPRGLKGEDIPLLARITSVVDAFDVMTNDRPYQKARSIPGAIEELRRCAGTQFDPKIVRIFCRLLRENNPQYKLTKECL